MQQFLEWLQGTGLASIARESLYGFQILVGIHLLGLIFSVGMLLWVDLRMLGLGLTNYRLSAVYRSLSKWFLFGFGAMFLSGIAIFSGFAVSAADNTWFRVKIAVMVLAGVNAVMFHRYTQRMPAEADLASTPPAAVRLAGLASLLFWATVIVCGRMISYTLF
jgi:Family of unknown function (DUF6644)